MTIDYDTWKSYFQHLENRENFACEYCKVSDLNDCIDCRTYIEEQNNKEIEKQINNILN